MPSVQITEALPEPATAVSLTALTRSDTGLTPTGVTLPLAFTDQGGGTAWAVAFTDPDALPPRYDFTYRVTWPDASTSDVTSSITPGEAIGFWTMQAKVEKTYGTASLGNDANLSNDGTGVAAVWQQALDDVDAWIDRLFRANGYTPVRPPVASASIDYPAIEPLARALVRVRLYQARGWADTRGLGNVGGDVSGAFAKLERDAKAELTAIAAQGVDWATADPTKDTETVGAISVVPTYDPTDEATDEFATT